MARPYLTIDIGKIESNSRVIVDLCRAHGIAVTGVTKGVGGHPEIAKAMLRGGVVSIADSRMENIDRLKRAGIESEIMLLRLPPLSGVDETVAKTNISLNSELSVLAGLSQAALRLGVVHCVIAMVDLGDLREGLWPDDLAEFVCEALKLPGIRLAGIGTNLACFGGVVPSVANMNRLVELVEEIEGQHDLKLDWISGVNSSGLNLIAEGKMPRRANHARIGEAILLGRETIRRRAWPNTYQDTFVLHTEVLEQKWKPSVPIGEIGEDAFGQHPHLEDRGDRLRALLNVGHEDVDVRGLTALDPGVAVLGATSGYLVADVTDVAAKTEVGSVLAFSLNYSALLAAMSSEYVKKVLVD